MFRPKYMLLLVVVVTVFGAAIDMPVVTKLLDRAVPVYELDEVGSQRVLLTPNVVWGLAVCVQSFPPTSNVDAAFPPLSVSVTRTFVGTFADETMDPKLIVFVLNAM